MQGPAVVAGNEGRAIEVAADRAMGELVAKGASTANSIAPRAATVPKTLPVQAATHPGPERPPSKGRPEDSTSHAPQTLLRSDQSESQQLSNIPSTTVTA